MRILRTENSIHRRSNNAIHIVIALLVIGGLVFVYWKNRPPEEPARQTSDLGQEEGVSPAPNEAFAFSVSDQPAGPWVAVTGIIAPTDFWLAIYEMREDKYGNILGAARVRAGAATTTVELLRPMTPGGNYAGVAHQDDGDIEFNYVQDIPLERDGSWLAKRFQAL
jgi:hypothetical protein